MTHTRQLMDRRDVLRGAAAVAATAVVGLSRGSADAATPSVSKSATTIAYWNGASFVNPASVAPADPSVFGKGARITVIGYSNPNPSSPPNLKALKARFAIQTTNGTQDVPFLSWVSFPYSIRRSKFKMPVAPVQGLVFSVDSAANGDEYYYLSLNASAGSVGLRTGTYIIASGSPDWTSCHITKKNGVPVVMRGKLAANFEYLPIMIDHG